MRIAFMTFTVCYLFFLSGCVTFNSLDFEKSKDEVKKKNLCINLEFKQINRLSSTKKLVDLHKMTVEEINRTLKNLNIDTACASADAKKFVVILNDKTPLMMPIFAGVTSIFTVLSLGLIPTYYSGTMELVLMDRDQQLLTREFSFSTLMWLPMVIKQWQDDKKAFDLYDVDAQSAILGIEIGDLLMQYAELQKKN